MSKSTFRLASRRLIWAAVWGAAATTAASVESTTTIFSSAAEDPGEAPERRLRGGALRIDVKNTGASALEVAAPAAWDPGLPEQVLPAGDAAAAAPAATGLASGLTSSLVRSMDWLWAPVNEDEPPAQFDLGWPNVTVETAKDDFAERTKQKG